MMLPIALQLYSVRDDIARDFPGTLRQVKALGFDGVELAGLFGFSPEQIRAWMDEAGLEAISAHVPFQDLLANPQKIMADYRTIGCSYIVIPYLTPEYRPGAELFPEVIRGARMIGLAAKAAGLTLLYHNHDFEFARIDGEYALDILYREVPADLLQTELDTCWVRVAGENPAAYLRQYSGRAPVVHLKDFVMPDHKPASLYKLIGLETEAAGSTDADAGTEATGFEFRPLGSGVQDFPAILAAVADAGSHWVVIEQDEPSSGLTPLACAAASIRYLQAIAG